MNQVTVSCPSRGLLENSHAEITLREPTVKEEKRLFSSQRPFLKVINLVKACIAAPQDVNVRKLPLVDFMCLFLNLRSLAMGKDYKTSISCSSCGKMVPVSLIIPDELDIIFAPDDISDTFDVELDDCVLTIKHSRVEDQLKATQEIRKRKARSTEEFDEGFVYRTASRIVAIDGDEKPFSSYEAFVESRTHSQFAALTEGMKKHDFGIDLRIPYDCNNCGNLDEVMLPIQGNFFRFSSR